MTEHSLATPLTDPEAIISAAMARIAASDSEVRAWEVLASDSRLHSIQARADAPLAGITLGVKDVIDVAGLPTRAGSRSRAAIAPAEQDATVVQRLREAGCLVVGKTKTTEFAYTDPTDTRNPHRLSHTPGGSSSGSAAAVAAGHVDLALGTQTVGSVCRPAAYCGVAAFKPSTGSTPLHGVTPLSRSFDTVGFLARDMRLAVNAYHCCSTAFPSHDTDQKIDFDILRVGVLADDFYRADESMLLALETGKDLLAQSGATIVSMTSGCDFASARQHQRVMMFYEAAQDHGELLAVSDQLGPNWLTALQTGKTIPGAEYRAARDALAEFKAALAESWSTVDYMLLPPTRSTAPEGLHSTGDAALIVPWTIAGSPLGVLPVSKDGKGLPSAIMIAGAPWTDRRTGAFLIQLQDLLPAAGHQPH